MHAPHDEFRQGDRRVEQVRLAPEVPVVVHEVHSHDNIGLLVPADATSRVEQLQYLQLGCIAVNVPTHTVEALDSRLVGSKGAKLGGTFLRGGSGLPEVALGHTPEGGSE